MLFVTAAHLALALFLALSGCIQSQSRKKPEVMRVNLVALPAPQEPQKRERSPAQTKKPEQAPQSKDEQPPKARTPTPVPPPKKETTKPKPEKKKWVARKPEEILAAHRARTPKPTTSPRTPSVSAGQIASRLAERVPVGRVSTLPTSPTSAEPRDMQRYRDAVGALLHRMWHQPNRSEIGDGTPKATIRIRVLADGSVVGRTLVHKSTASAMNRSVAQVMVRLDRLPAFRDYGINATSLDIPVVFEVN